MKAVRIHEFGGPDQFVYEDVETPEPGPGQVRIKIEAAGLNYIDVYQRTGQYPIGLPQTLGMEAAGTVDAIGDGVDLNVGDRVAYAMGMGAYAEYALMPANNVVPVPEGVSSEQAAALMLQGMTAHYLSHTTYPLKDGDVALIHAAAGGVGLLLIQMAKRLGARVIGTVSTQEKADLAKQAGADEVILYTEADFQTESRKLTQGEGVHVVYDSVGKTTFEKSLNSLRPRGYMVLYGQASGPVGEFDPQILNAKGSLFLTRPSLFHYSLDRDELLWRSGDLFSWVQAGELDVRIDQTFALSDVAKAHEYIEARKTKGKVLLIP